MSGLVGITHAGLTKGKVGKATGNNRKISAYNALREFGEVGQERQTQSEHYDPSKSGENIYRFFIQTDKPSGLGVLKELNKQLKDWEEPQVIKKGKNAGKTVIRKARKDKVFAEMFIIKPSPEVLEGMTKKQIVKYFSDALATLREIAPVPFGENLLALTIQFDEATPHLHGVYSTQYNGKWSRKLPEFEPLKLYLKINREFPEKMRAKGYDIGDYDLYDPLQAEEDPTYLEKRLAKRAKQGLSANDYGAMKDIERLEGQVKELQGELEESEKKRAALEAQLKKLTQPTQPRRPQDDELQAHIENIRRKQAEQNRGLSL